MNWFWRVYYFEAGAEQPYRSRHFLTRSHLECALARFSRMGGDDVLQVIPPRSRRRRTDTGSKPWAVPAVAARAETT